MRQNGTKTPLLRRLQCMRDLIHALQPSAVRPLRGTFKQRSPALLGPVRRIAEASGSAAPRRPGSQRANCCLAENPGHTETISGGVGIAHAYPIRWEDCRLHLTVIATLDAIPTPKRARAVADEPG